MEVQQSLSGGVPAASIVPHPDVPVLTPLCASIVERTLVPLGATGSTDVMFYRPRGPGGPLPLVYFLASGEAGSDAADYGALANELAEGAAVNVVLLRHDKGGGYPARNRLALEILRHILASPWDYGIDPERVAIVGDGLGGNLAAALALPEGGAAIAGLRLQVLICPILAELRMNGRGDTDEHPNTTAILDQTNRIFPDRSARLSPAAFPGLAGAEQLAGSPAALILVAEKDATRAGTESFATSLRLAGVGVVCVTINGARHDFIAHRSADPGAYRAAKALIIASIRDAMDR